mgnify:FL=1
MLGKFLVKVKRLVNDTNQRKTIYFVMIRGLSVISNYIFSLLIIKLFSTEDYGVFVESLSVLMILCVLLKFGVDVHFVKIFSEFKLSGVPRWIREIESKVLFLSALVTLLFVIIFQLSNLFSNTKYGITMIILSTPIIVMVHLNSSKLRAISSIVKYAFLNIAGRIFLSLCVLCILYFVFNKVTIDVIYSSHFIAISILFLISFFWIKKQFSTNNNTSSFVPISFTSYNRPLMLKSYITVLFLWGDRFFLSLICSPDQVAKYDISLKIAMVMMITIEALKATYAPVIARSLDDKKILLKHIKRSSFVGFFASAIVLSLLIILGQDLLSLFGPEFIQSYPIVVVIGTGYFISSFFGQADSVIEMSGLANYYIRPYFTVIGAGLLVGVSLSFTFGALGMAIGFSISNILFQLCASRIVYNKLNITTTPIR